MAYAYITPYRSLPDAPERPQTAGDSNRDKDFTAPLLDDANITVKENA